MIYRDAIAIIGSDRLAYFQQVVQSVARNHNIENFDIFVFLDRSRRPDADDIMREHIEVVNNRLPKATIVTREENWGCGKNIIDVRRHLFDRLGYDKVFIVEDDMLLSDTYFSFCLNMLKWSRERYGNIGAVQGWNRCFIPKAQKHKYLNDVRATFIENWWGYVITHECWNDIKDVIYKFEQDNLSCNYWERDHQKIIRWFKNTFSEVRSRINPFTVDDIWLNERDRVVGSPPTGQDAVTSLAMYYEGYVRLAPIVNRGQYIGQVGIHMTPAWFIRERFNEVILHNFPEDDHPKAFKPSYGSIKYEEETFLEGIERVTV